MNIEFKLALIFFTLGMLTGAAGVAVVILGEIRELEQKEKNHGIKRKNNPGNNRTLPIV